MIRKYTNPNVKIGDYVYWSDGFEETKKTYKVVRINKQTETITVEIDKQTELTCGWTSPELGNKRYWNVIFWEKKSCQIMELE